MSSSTASQPSSIVEADIPTLRHFLDTNQLTSVQLVYKYLQRISTYGGVSKLNSIPILNPSVFDDAAASDAYRASGKPTRPLEGIPFTVKDSYKVAGLTVASGSPAFQNLVANEDAFTVKLLKEAGAVLIGKTNMPPMAAGGMQRGVYGRAESPYNAEYLTAAFGSGSSNGSATATAASFAAFGMGEETVSSGRSPASNNGLVAYTPSRGVLSIRGNWPLYPTCDVVVPHTRTMRDLLEILEVIVQKDEVTQGDFWRDQPWIKLPNVKGVRLASYLSLIDESKKVLEGKRFGVPKMYVNGDGGKHGITTRESIMKLYRGAKKMLESLGATVVECDFPVMTMYDAGPGSSPTSAQTTEKTNGITDAWNKAERKECIAYSWDDFLRQNHDPNFPSLAAVDPSTIFPRPPGSIPDRYTQERKPVIDYAAIVEVAQARTTQSIFDIPGTQQALKTLEQRRKDDFESWLDAQNFDAVIFPANADVGKADTDVNEESAVEAWKNGVLYSNGNRVLRHLGIPTVSVTMGIMADTKLPVNLTFAGKAYEDSKLLTFAYAYEQESKCRRPPGETPTLESDFVTGDVAPRASGNGSGISSPSGVNIGRDGTGLVSEADCQALLSAVVINARK